MVYTGSILRELQIYFSCPCPYSGPEPVEDIMELDTGSYTSVCECLYHLPEDLKDPYALGVCGPFGYEDRDSPPQLLWDIPFFPHVLDNFHQAHPALRLRGGVF